MRHFVEEIVGNPQFFLFARNLLLVELKLLQLVLEVQLLTPHQLAGFVKHIFRESDTLGNLKGEA